MGRDSPRGLQPDKPCGVVASASPEHQNPWLVALEFYDEQGRLLYIRCEGVLITLEIILTVAHCVYIFVDKWRVQNITLIARLGMSNMSMKHDLAMVIQDEVVHPGYRKPSRSNSDDVAILVLEVEAPYTDTPCGVVASTSPLHQHPWLVMLEYYHGRRWDPDIRCGGTLIGPRHILTSAHCIFIGLVPYIMLPRLGEYNMSSEPDCVGGVCAAPALRMVVQTVFVRPGYDRHSPGNDLAILVLETEAPYTDSIRPICLVSGVLDRETEFHAAGFGATPLDDSYSNVKKDIPLPYYPDCQRIYKKLPPDFLCAGGIRNVDTCRGDSGGPLVKINEKVKGKTAELWGVTKGGNPICGEAGIPGVYINVSYHLDWINDIIMKTAKNIPNDNPGHTTNHTNDNNGSRDSSGSKNIANGNPGQTNHTNDNNGIRDSSDSKNIANGNPGQTNHTNDNKDGSDSGSVSLVFIFVIVLCMYVFFLILFSISYMVDRWVIQHLKKLIIKRFVS